MCDVTAGSGGSRPGPHPRWGLLYGLAALTLAALAAVEVVVSPGAARTVLRCGLALCAFAAMAVWARSNRVALDQQDWCACAAEKTRVRVILSHGPEPRRVPGEAIEESTLEPAVAGQKNW